MAKIICSMSGNYEKIKATKMLNENHYISNTKFYFDKRAVQTRYDITVCSVLAVCRVWRYMEKYRTVIYVHGLSRKLRWMALYRALSSYYLCMNVEPTWYFVIRTHRNLTLLAKYFCCNHHSSRSVLTCDEHGKNKKCLQSLIRKSRVNHIENRMWIGQ